MEQNEIVEIIKRELPGAMERSPELTDFILNLTEGRYARRSETNDRFYELLGELRRDREEQKKLWEQHREEDAIYRAQQDEKWEQHRKDQEKLRAEQREEWEQYKLKLDERWAADRADWERYRQELRDVLTEQREEWKQYQLRQDELRAADRADWERYRKELQDLRSEQRELWKEQRQANLENQRYHERLEQRVGAMGARWGTQSEKSFRNALKGILEEHFPIRVLNVTEFDEDGVVFGRPATIELDLIIKDGLLIICEIKSSVSLGDAFVFSKKVAFYEERHNRKADKLIMISPMVDKKARKFAQETGIKIYTFAHEIEPEIV